MCGIAGIFGYADSAPPVDREELLRIREAMIKRGPDGAGLWIAPDRRVGLAHRRLAIIDLSEAGAQPMATADGRLQITFNGEIYNYRELRRELEAKGFVFRTNSDTEVLLHLYADRGEDMVHALRGMYAFGLWDQSRQGLFLVRDPFGIKPLYLADDGKTIRFASQVKALLAGAAIACDEEPAGYAGFLLWGYVPEPFTLYRAIRSLPAGSRLWISRSGSRTESSFFSIRDEIAVLRETARPVAPDEVREVLAAVVEMSVRRHMVSDVSVGMFLSSGLDSSLIAAHAAEYAPGRLHSVTLGFSEYRGTSEDETVLAAGLAAQIGATHETRWVSRDDFFANLDPIFTAMDQPTTDGINTYLVSQAAAQAGMKVALSGLGGDELFAGYPSFIDVPRIVRNVRRLPDLPRLARALRRVASPLIGAVSSPKFAGALEYGRNVPDAYLLRRALFMPWELQGILDADLVEEGLRRLDTVPRLGESIRGIRNERLEVSALEMEWYMRGQLLRDADWAGMAHSLEIRVPYVDLDVFKAVTRLVLGGWNARKRDAIAACGKQLPEAILQRAKTGFIVPVRDWLVQRYGGGNTGRGLRPWAPRVLSHIGAMRRSLMLTTEAHGGFGGIALYNRDVLESLCEEPGCREVVAIPRLVRNPVGELPAVLRYVMTGVNGKTRFLRTVLATLASMPRTDVVLCGHINLLPLAWLAARRYRAPLVLFIYGIDAWKPPTRWLPAFLLNHVTRVVSISEVTKQRFLAWSGLSPNKVSVVPNAIHLEEFSPAPKDAGLVKRYGLNGKRVLMTLGRMVSAERYKGFDEVIEAMPSLGDSHKDLVYLACGDGSDRARLEAKAASLGVSERVVFTGQIPEHEKAAHYRLADAYVMPSRGEGFAFVLIEAVACGVPAVGSLTDGGREALRDGKLGILVNPDDPEDIQRGITEALGREAGKVPEGLTYFAYPHFAVRLQRVLTDVLRASTFR